MEVFMLESSVACVANIAHFYGMDLNVAELKRSQNNRQGFEKLARENGLKIRKITCTDLKLPDSVMFPLIAEVYSSVANDERTEYCFISKRSGKFLYIVTDSGVNVIHCYEFEKRFTGTLYFMTPKKDFTQSSGSVKDVFRFFSLLKSEKRNLSKIFCASMMLCFFGLLTAFYFRFLIDEVFGGGLINMLNSFSLAFLAVIIFQCILSFARNQLLNFLGHKIDATIVMEYFSHVLQLPMKFFSKFKTGEIMSRMHDGTTIRNLISTTFLSVLIDTVMLVFGAIFLFWFGSKLILVSIISVICGAIVAKIFAKPYREKMLARAKAEAAKQSMLVEFVNGVETIKAVGAIDNAVEKCEEKIIKAAKQNLNISTTTNLQNTLQYFIQQVGRLGMYWFGGNMVINGEMTLGQLISFVILSQYFVGPLFRFLTLQPTLQEAETAARRLIEVFDQKVEEDGGTKITSGTLTGDIDLHDVNFSYGSGKEQTLSNINLHIPAGSKVAFVGESGSGKSTVAKLLMKFQNATSGEIMIDGKNIDDYGIEFLRNNIGYVPQDSLLFHGTVAENISFGKNSAAATDIFMASISSQADKFIRRLPKRYETYIGERGASLSGGERQRLSIARMLLKNPQVFILDESTSALDSMLEKSVMDAIQSLAEDKTLIMISHKLSTVKNFDTIFVFDNGEIIESGTHDELLLLNGKYAELWYTQNMEVAA